MSLRFIHVTREGLAPYLPSLRALEGGIRYPIADGADHFTIDHGPAYHPFFSGLGEAHFLLAVREGTVVGSVVGVLREVTAAGRPVQALYMCDLKLLPELRGQGIARRLLQRGLIEIIKHPRGRKARLLYGAAMRGASGDVMRTARGSHPLRLSGKLATFRLYFVEPEKLAAFDGDGPGWDGVPALALSALEGGMVETAGAKDLRLASTGAPWPLVHLATAPWMARPSWGAWLRACGERLLQRSDRAMACFALDDRLSAHHQWLASSGIAPGAGCTTYGLALTGSVRAAEVAHLATSEI